MCRRNQLGGMAALFLGLGLLIGCWLESEGARNVCGILLVAGGVLLLQKK